MTQEPTFYTLQDIGSMLHVYVEVGLVTADELNTLPGVLKARRDASDSSVRTDQFTIFYDPRYEREASMLSISTFLDDRIKERAK